MRRAAVLAAALATAAFDARAATFSVNFDDGLGASSFTTTKSASSTINYAFDYSTYHYYKSAFPGFPIADQGPIPQAPSSTGSATVGMKMTARTLSTDGVGWASALANFPIAAGGYRMNFDMWINYNGGPTGGAGSTEFTYFGMNSSGSGMLKNISTFASTAEGYAMTTTGEGGSGTDYRIYYTDPTDDGPAWPKANAKWEAPDPVAPATTPRPDNEVHPFYSQAGLFGGNESPGAPGKSWVKVTVEQTDPTHVAWYFNGIKVTSLTLAEAADGKGMPFIGYGDTITGPPGTTGGGAGDQFGDAFVLIDNVRIESLGVGVAGDYNGDGFVDSADYTVWADHFGQTGAGVPGDGNADGKVDSADYTVWADHFGQGTPHGVSIPEPGHAVLLGAGVTVLLCRRR